VSGHESVKIVENVNVKRFFFYHGQPVLDFGTCPLDEFLEKKDGSHI
jgi:hypothetical protein